MLATVVGKTLIESAEVPSSLMACQPAPPRSIVFVKCSASIETHPSSSTNPLASGPGLKSATFTVCSVPAPAMEIEAVASAPAGAFFGSTPTQMRCSEAIVPEDSLSVIHGASGVAVQSNGVVPVLKMSMNRFCPMREFSGGNEIFPPSAATPNPAADGGLTCATGGIRKTACICGASDIMNFHLPLASASL